MADLLVVAVSSTPAVLNGARLGQHDMLVSLSAVPTPHELSQHLLTSSSRLLPVLVIKAAAAELVAVSEQIRRLTAHRPDVFIMCVHAHELDADCDSATRFAVFNAGANMLTYHAEDIKCALNQLRGQRAGPFACVFCRLQLDEDSLWVHTPLYHENLASPAAANCPVCRRPSADPVAVHIRNAHGPCARGEVRSEYANKTDRLYAFALVVCVRQSRSGGQEMLLVHEFAGQGFWLPGGRVESGESLQEAARRECLEETGVSIQLEGVLQVQYSPSRGGGGVRLRVVFYATTSDDNNRPKTVPDFESCGATWVPLADITGRMAEEDQLRGQEPRRWAEYLSNSASAVIHPLSVLGREE